MTKIVAAIAVLAAPVAIASGCANQSANNPSTGTTTTTGANAQQLTTQLNTTDGKHVANATIDFTSGYATVTVETSQAGVLSPGFHGLHIHAVGVAAGAEPFGTFRTEQPRGVEVHGLAVILVHMRHRAGLGFEQLLGAPEIGQELRGFEVDDAAEPGDQMGTARLDPEERKILKFHKGFR